jgi:hypothetical protein
VMPANTLWSRFVKRFLIIVIPAASARRIM